jgi:acetyl-CoA acyltransferase
VNDVFVVDACRTPIGKVKGVLADVRPDHLAADVITALTGAGRGRDRRRLLGRG